MSHPQCPACGQSVAVDAGTVRPHRYRVNGTHWCSGGNRPYPPPPPVCPDCGGTGTLTVPDPFLGDWIDTACPCNSAKGA